MTTPCHATNRSKLESIRDEDSNQAYQSKKKKKSCFHETQGGMKRCDRKGSMQRLMTPIVWIWDTGTRLPAISDVLQRWRAPRQTEISVSPVIFESFVTQGGDSWKILLFWWMEQYLARHIILNIIQFPQNSHQNFPFFFTYPLLFTWIDDSFHCSQFFKEFLWECAGNGMIYSSQGGFNWEEFRFWLV